MESKKIGLFRPVADVAAPPPGRPSSSEATRATSWPRSHPARSPAPPARARRILSRFSL